MKGLCFVGCGSIAAKHAKLAAKHTQFNLYFASRDKEKAESYKNRFGGIKAFGSYEDAANDESVNVLFICTPPIDHLNTVLTCINAGKEVIIEKPAARSVSEIDTMIQAAKNKEVRCMVAENYQFKPSIRKIMSIIKSGEIGELHHVDLKKAVYQKVEGWRGDPNLSGGGALMEGGVHWIRALTLIGGNVISLSATSPDFEERSGSFFETTTDISVVFENGATGHLFHSWSVPAKLKGLSLSRIHGSRGTIYFESNGLFVTIRGKRNKIYFPGLGDLLGYKGMFKEINDCFIHGKDISSDLHSARNDIAFVESVYKSIKNESKVHLYS